ncbi:MAG: IS66 family transposase, partial [Oscillospiraceae bacterium]|nr:IS66 family transposase [Oscillospiraceae bacterium]
MEQLRLSRHRQFGSKSEQTPADDYVQLSLFDEPEVYSTPDQAEPTMAEIVQSYKRRKKAATERLPEDLPVEIIDDTLPESARHCGACQAPYVNIGVETRDTLKLAPAKAYILRERRHVYACKACEATSDSTPIDKAPIPPALLPGSLASAEAVALLMTQKFVLGTPLYRQEQDWKGRGILLSRQTMSNWLVACSERYVKPLLAVMHQQLVEQPVLHADETPLQVLHEPGKAPQSKSYMWLYRTGACSRHPLVLFDDQPDRKGQHPRDYLAGFQGYLHTDGYSGYNQFPPGITRVGCWAHARRTFEEALQAQPPKRRKSSPAAEGKRFCDRLFDIEADLKALDPDIRYQQRQEKAKPQVEAFFTWLKQLPPLGKTLFANAVTYGLNQEAALP